MVDRKGEGLGKNSKTAIRYYSHCCDADMDGPVLTTTAGVSVCGVCRRCREYTTFDEVVEEEGDGVSEG